MDKLTLSKPELDPVFSEGKNSKSEETTSKKADKGDVFVIHRKPIYPGSQVTVGATFNEIPHDK